MILQELTLSGLAKRSSNFMSLPSSLFPFLCGYVPFWHSRSFHKAVSESFSICFFCKAYKRVDVSFVFNEFLSS